MCVVRNRRGSCAGLLSHRRQLSSRHRNKFSACHSPPAARPLVGQAILDVDAVHKHVSGWGGGHRNRAARKPGQGSGRSGKRHVRLVSFQLAGLRMPLQGTLREWQGQASAAGPLPSSKFQHESSPRLRCPQMCLPVVHPVHNHVRVGAVHCANSLDADTGAVWAGRGLTRGQAARHGEGGGWPAGRRQGRRAGGVARVSAVPLLGLHWSAGWDQIAGERSWLGAAEASGVCVGRKP